MPGGEIGVQVGVGSSKGGWGGCEGGLGGNKVGKNSREGDQEGGREREEGQREEKGIRKYIVRQRRGRGRLLYSFLLPELRQSPLVPPQEEVVRLRR